MATSVDEPQYTGRAPITARQTGTAQIDGGVSTARVRKTTAKMSWTTRSPSHS